MMWTVILLMDCVDGATTLYMAQVVAPSPEEAAIGAVDQFDALDELDLELFEIVDLVVLKGHHRDHATDGILAALNRT